MRYKNNTELLKETYYYYCICKNNRAISFSSSPANGLSGFVIETWQINNNKPKKSMCPIGRCLRKTLQKSHFILNADTVGMAECDFNGKKQSINNILRHAVRPEYSKVSFGLWSELRKWHDNPDNWDGISSDPTVFGLLEYNKMLLKYSL